MTKSSNGIIGQLAIMMIESLLFVFYTQAELGNSGVMRVRRLINSTLS